MSGMAGAHPPEMAQKEDEIGVLRENLDQLEKSRYKIDQKSRFAKSEYDAVKYSFEVKEKANLTDEAAELRSVMDDLLVEKSTL